MPKKKTDAATTTTDEKPKKPRKTAAQKLRVSAEEAPPAPASIDPTQSEARYALKRKVRVFYDLQRLRLQISGRIEPKAEGSAIQLSEYDKFALRSRASELLDAEARALGDVQDHLKAIAFYRDILSDKSRYRGVGPTLAGVLLAEVDWANSGTPSQVWAFAGLKPLDAYRCKKCHGVLEAVEGDGTVAYRHTMKPVGKDACDAKLTSDAVYASGKAQRPVRGEKLPYNAWLRMKLVGVLGPVLLKVGSPWRKFYDDYKHRKESAGWGRSDAHRHQAAIRYMVKMLVAQVWEDFRKFHGLPVRDSYAAEYLGRSHHERPKRPTMTVDPEAARAAMLDAEIALEVAREDEVVVRSTAR